MYAVKEIYYSLQGEGAQTGPACRVLRFAGCNLWSGREADRAGATAISATRISSAPTAQAAAGSLTPTRWPKRAARRGAAMEARRPFVVLTGGEPMLQVDEPLIAALHALCFEIAIETNGTLPVPRAIDWICVSPKADAPLVQRRGDELKLVYPQSALRPAQVEALDFRHFLLQPMDDGPASPDNLARAIAYCREHPQWRLSLQTHKLLGLR